MNALHLLGGLGVGVLIGLFAPAGVAIVLTVCCLIAAILPMLKAYQMLFLGTLVGMIFTFLIKYYGVVSLT